MSRRRIRIRTLCGVEHDTLFRDGHDQPRLLLSGISPGGHDIQVVIDVDAYDPAILRDAARDLAAKQRDRWGMGAA